MKKYKVLGSRIDNKDYDKVYLKNSNYDLNLLNKFILLCSIFIIIFKFFIINKYFFNIFFQRLNDIFKFIFYFTTSNGFI